MCSKIKKQPKNFPKSPKKFQKVQTLSQNGKKWIVYGPWMDKIWPKIVLKPVIITRNVPIGYTLEEHCCSLFTWSEGDITEVTFFQLSLLIFCLVRRKCRRNAFRAAQTANSQEIVFDCFHLWTSLKKLWYQKNNFYTINPLFVYQ